MKRQPLKDKTDYHEIVNDIGQYVHDHLDETINIDLLSARVSVSKYHLNRIFQVITGYQLGEFVTRRRMERAYALLSAGDASVLDAALSVGYESHSAFSRAFHKVFGFRPSEAQKHTVTEVRIANTLKGSPSLSMKPEVRRRTAMKIAGLYGAGFKNQAFTDVAQSLFKQVYLAVAREKIGDPAKFRHIGVSLDNPWRGNHGEAVFFAGLALPESTEPEGLQSFTWEAGAWAKVAHRGAYREIWQTVSRVYAGWVIPRGIRLRDAAIVQEYLNNPADTPEPDLETHLYFALLD